MCEGRGQGRGAGLLRAARLGEKLSCDSSHGRAAKAHLGSGWVVASSSRGSRLRTALPEAQLGQGVGQGPVLKQSSRAVSGTFW